MQRLQHSLQPLQPRFAHPSLCSLLGLDRLRARVVACRMAARESTIDRPFRRVILGFRRVQQRAGQERKATTKPRASHGRKWRLVLQPLIGAVTAVANLIRLVHRIGLLESLTDKQCRTPSANCAGPSAGVRTPSFTDEALRVAKTDWDADVPSAQPQ